MQVTVHVAKTHLSKLIEAALRGEDVVIARGAEPVVRLVAIPRTTFKLGLLEGKIDGAGPDFFAPLDADDLDLWEGGR